MASSNFLASTAVLMLLLITSASTRDFMPPSYSPSSFDICSEVNCGKGNCTIDSGSQWNFSCACQNGWKHSPSDNGTYVQYLPCIYPNCSLNYSCMPALPPAPAMQPWPLINSSNFDVCDWIDCGRGDCINNSTYSYTCQCHSGFYNVLSNPAFPCYSNCSFGSESCQKLGISVTNSTSSSVLPGNPVPAASPSQSPAPSFNNATGLLPGKFHWIAIICVLMISSRNAMGSVILWK